MEEEAAPSLEWTLEKGLEEIIVEEMEDMAESTIREHERRQVGAAVDGAGLDLQSIDLPDGVGNVQDERDAVLQAMLDMQPMFTDADAADLNAESTFVSWSADNDVGFAVLRERHAVIESIGLQRSSQIALVHAGIEVKLDDQDRVIYSMSLRVVPASYAEDTIVHPAVGIRMLKVKGSLRPEMPAGIRRLQRMWSAAAHVTEEPACVLCRKAGGKEAPVKVCVLCMAPMHLPCAALLHCKFTAAVAEKTRFTSELPPLLSGKLCILCESRVQYGTVQGE